MDYNSNLSVKKIPIWKGMGSNFLKGLYSRTSLQGIKRTDSSRFLWWGALTIAGQILQARLPPTPHSYGLPQLRKHPRAQLCHRKWPPCTARPPTLWPRGTPGLRTRPLSHLVRPTFLLNPMGQSPLWLLCLLHCPSAQLKKAAWNRRAQGLELYRPTTGSHLAHQPAGGPKASQPWLCHL